MTCEIVGDYCLRHEQDATACRQPLGISDLEVRTRLSIVGLDHRLTEHWYWCRRHEQSRRDGAPCIDKRYTPYNIALCIRVGPFMSEREAIRLRGDEQRIGEFEGPLGMEVE